MEGDSTKANLLEEDLSKLLLDLDSNSEFPSQLPLHRLDSGEAGQMPEVGHNSDGDYSSFSSQQCT